MNQAKYVIPCLPSAPAAQLDVTSPVLYHRTLDQELEDWARLFGWTVSDLRSATERALRERTSDVIADERHEAAPPAPATYTLALAGTRPVQMHYTVELRGLVVRGYSGAVADSPDGEEDGAVYNDGEWFRPVMEALRDELFPATKSDASAALGSIHEAPELRPRIYVASLSDYNAGRLHGKWMDAAVPADEVRAAIKAMLEASREPLAEEFAIHDYEGFAGYAVHEFVNVEHVCEVATLLVEHGPVFAGLLNHFGGDLEQARDYIECAYNGAYQDVGEYAFTMTQDLYTDALKDLPEFIRHNIDWDAIGHDLELGGDIFTVEVAGEVHVFDSHL